MCLINLKLLLLIADRYLVRSQSQQAYIHIFQYIEPAILPDDNSTQNSTNHTNSSENSTENGSQN